MFKPRFVIKNDKGEDVFLNEVEQRVADMNQKIFNERIKNTLGVDLDITILTTIVKKVTEQKFFTLTPSDFMPVAVGNGAWGQVLTTYRQFDIAGAFEDGLLNTGADQARLSSADAAVDAINVAIFNWAKSISWSVMDLAQAQKAGNWDLITAKETARKRNWDLGIQKIAFLGISGNTNCYGWMNQPNVTVNSSFISGPISQMASVDLKAFCFGIMNLYRANCNRTAFPSVFSVPESDYLGLASTSSPDFPIKSVKQVLEEMFQSITQNPNFKILCNAYGDTAYSGDSVMKYVLSSYDETSGRMDVPVPYTNTLANTMNNFTFENAAYGQFTGYKAYRDTEMYYLTCANPS